VTATAKHIIFDLDGTLVDSAAVLVEIVNEMLIERGSARRANVEQARPFLSLGGLALVTGLLGAECGNPAAEVSEFRRRYSARSTTADSLYEGVYDGLQELASSGFNLAICSNKPQDLCEKVLRDLGLSAVFKAIVGSAPGLRAKPEPDLMHLAIERLGATPETCLLVGDSEVDQALAAATGVRFLFVSYGYAGKDWDTGSLTRFDNFPDLVRAIKTQQAAPPGLRAVA